MAKLLNLKDYILLGAAMMGEAFDDVRLLGGVVPEIFRSRYGFVPENFRRTTYFSQVSRMLRTDLLERKVDRKGNAYLELTARGFEEYSRRFPVFSKSKKWDRFFMQVTFDVPRDKNTIRNSIREYLKSLGFGKLQESVYISPYHFEEDLQEFLTRNDLSEYVFVMSVKKLLVGDLKVFASTVWRIDEINKRYEEVLKIFQKDSNLKNAWSGYLEILRDDPILPQQFLPKDWIGDTLVKVLNRSVLQK